jgi:hypothetical protein
VDVTDWFNNITRQEGTLAITPKPLTITACTAYKPYDGTPLICDSYTQTGLVAGDDIVHIYIEGDQTQIGSSENVIDMDYVFIMNGNDELVNDNYDITLEDGTLTVTPRVDINAGSWHPVSTPMHDADKDYWTFGDALATGFYDLFRYDEPTTTWENYKSGNFDHMAPARGYLYRSSDDFAIPYDGQFNSNPSYTIALTAEGAGDLRGFNLVGNPYPYRVFLDRAFYSLNADGTWTLHPDGDSIAAGQGVLVHAIAAENLTFYAATRSTNPGAKGALPPLPKGLCLGDCDEEQNTEHLTLNTEHFAVWNGDHLVILGEGTLTAYDIIGRELFHRDVNSDLRIPTSEFPAAGVYLLRLGGQSQKIVIK